MLRMSQMIWRGLCRLARTAEVQHARSNKHAGDGELYEGYTNLENERSKRTGMVSGRYSQES